MAKKSPKVMQEKLLVFIDVISGLIALFMLYLVYSAHVVGMRVLFYAAIGLSVIFFIFHLLLSIGVIVMKKQIQADPSLRYRTEAEEEQLIKENTHRQILDEIYNRD